MFEIALVNPPFASVRLPSLALTQLKAVLDARLSGLQSSEIVYLNHDFAQRIGVELYQHVGVDMEAPYNGFGDWLFRQAAFPGLEDNADIYFPRFFPHRTEANERLKADVARWRPELVRVMDELVVANRLHERDLVGISSMFSQNMASFTLARLIKERNPDVIVVMGGANCETPMGQEIVKNVASVDYVFAGTSLKSFPDFVEALANGDREAATRTKGVFARETCDESLLRGPSGDELPLDGVLALDYDGFIASLEGKFPEAGIEPILLFETSRGCWWGEKAHCTFCGLNGVNMGYRSMGAELARETIASLFRYADKVSRLQSVDNIMPKHYPAEVFAKLATPPHMTIFYEVKADLTDEDMAVLSKSGVREVQPGIEALATSTLKLMRKGTTAFQNVRFLKNCVRREIFPDWSILVGFPGEEASVYEKYVADVPKLVHLSPPSGVYPVRPDRFSPYHQYAEDYGLELRPADFYELVYPFEKGSIDNLAYFFRDYNFAAEYFEVMVQWFDRLRTEVEQWRAKWANGELPVLYRDGSVVVDTRTGQSREHQLDDAARDLLDSLTVPRRRKDIVADSGRADGAEALAELASLDLLFEEGEHVMSLVLPERPPRSKRDRGWSWAS